MMPSYVAMPISPRRIMCRSPIVFGDFVTYARADMGIGPYGWCANLNNETTI